MKTRPVNATTAPAPIGGYSQALEVSGHTRLLFISGQVPEHANGAIPADFRGQALLVWQHVDAQLRAAGMSLANLVKVTTFLASREHAAENGEVRRQVLGTLAPALTVVVADIFDPRWLLEIEAIAAA